MSRLQADFLLLLTALIWGTAFVACKTGMDGIGPFSFSGVRFGMPLLVILPFVLHEQRTRPSLTRQDLLAGFGLSLIFTTAVILQQAGIFYTTVTNAGFLTGVGVVLVPFIAWALFRLRPQILVWPACVMAVAGIWFLNGGTLASFGKGDLLVMACAAAFAFQLVLLGVMVSRTRRPLTLSAIQYVVCAGIGIFIGAAFEGLDGTAIQSNLPELLYAGIISGGIAFTLQAVAQQHTPPADAAIILSGESLVAALCGALLLSERLSGMAWIGCLLIFSAILLVEAGSLLLPSKKSE